MSGQTITFKTRPKIVSVSSVAGTKESEGIIGKYADTLLKDDMFGETTYERAECKMLIHVIDGAIKKGGLKREDVGLLVSGDLLNQIISASFAAREFDIPFLGVYGACSTMAETLLMAAVLATRADGPVTLTGAECVKKSYPDFWEEYQRLGGEVHVL